MIRRIILICLLSLLLTFQYCFPQWELKSSGMTGGMVRSLCVSNSYIFAGAGSNIFMSTNDGEYWNSADIGFNSPTIRCIYASGNYIYAGTADGLYITSNNGQTWTDIGITLPNRNVLSVLNTGSYLFAGTGAGIYRTSNNGVTWIFISSGFENNMINALHNNNGYILAGTNNGVHVSSNSGNNWTPANYGLTELTIKCFTQTSNMVFSSSPVWIDMTTNNGITWSELYSLPNIYCLASRQSNIFAVSLWGVSQSSNYGSGWYLINEGLPASTVTYAVALSNNYIFIGRPDLVWRRNLSQLTDIKQTEETLPGEITLYQNYPNPFNGFTKIIFKIRHPGTTTLTVYDINGKTVDVLLNGILKEGKYETRFNSEELPSGVYFYVLKTNNGSEVRKMFLIK